MEYKLIKWYPSLPKDWEVGMEVGVGDYRITYSPCSSKYTDCYIASSEIKNNPEFWKKVEKKTYEILSFKFQSNGCLATLRENGKYLNQDTSLTDISWGAIEEYMLNFVNSDPSDCIIYSVKRLSDGEIFTIGDRCIWQGTGASDTGCVLKIEVKSDGVYLSNGSCNFHFSRVNKLKKISCTTVDGKEIFEGEEIWYVSCDFKVYSNKVNLFYSEKNYKYFSTKEAAEEYVIRNKPCLSLEEVEKVLIKESGIISVIRSLKELIKNKL